jgi:hypothetical protein
MIIFYFHLLYPKWCSRLVPSQVVASRCTLAPRKGKDQRARPTSWLAGTCSQNALQQESDLYASSTCMMHLRLDRTCTAHTCMINYLTLTFFLKKIMNYCFSFSSEKKRMLIGVYILINGSRCLRSDGNLNIWSRNKCKRMGKITSHLVYRPLSQHEQYLYTSLFWIIHRCSCGLWMINYMEYWTGTHLSDHVTQVLPYESSHNKFFL